MSPTRLHEACLALLALAEEELAFVLDGRVADDPEALADLAARREPLTEALLNAVTVPGSLDPACQDVLRRACDTQAAVTRALADATRAVVSELRGVGEGRTVAAAYARA